MVSSVVKSVVERESARERGGRARERGNGRQASQTPRTDGNESDLLAVPVLRGHMLPFCAERRTNARFSGLSVCRGREFAPQKQSMLPPTPPTPTTTKLKKKKKKNPSANVRSTNSSISSLSSPETSTRSEHLRGSSQRGSQRSAGLSGKTKSSSIFCCGN